MHSRLDFELGPSSRPRAHRVTIRQPSDHASPIVSMLMRTNRVRRKPHVKGWRYGESVASMPLSPLCTTILWRNVSYPLSLDSAPQLRLPLLRLGIEKATSRVTDWWPILVPAPRGYEPRAGPACSEDNESN